MDVTHPDKKEVRKWMQQRQVEQSPPPTPERIRELLGWKLIEGDHKWHQ